MTSTGNHWLRSLVDNVKTVLLSLRNSGMRFALVVGIVIPFRAAFAVLGLWVSILAFHRIGLSGKWDPTKERLRAMRDRLRPRVEEAEAGAFDGDCDWVDMASLRRDIACVPSDDDRADLPTVIRMPPALRVWHLAERFGALSSPRGNAE